jgi:glycolate oxidase FAD binding subunit
MTRLSGETQVVEFVRAARADRRPFEIVAGGTRRAVGKPMGDLPVADVSGLAGIVSYQPDELILTVRPGTALYQIRDALAEKNQCLGFDPAEWQWLGKTLGNSTLGGAVSSDASGSGRLRHGGARDSLLGFRGVNGLGEAFVAGGKVVKNVTGFDLPKLVCGAFGTLCVLTELTFRVYPRPRYQATLVLKDLAPDDGFAALRTIWRSALEPTGLAYVPGSVMNEFGKGAALIRLEGEDLPLQEKYAAARALLGAGERTRDTEKFIHILGEGAPFASSDLDVWRVHVPPSEAAKTAAALASPLWYGDWAGGLLWVGMKGEDAGRARAIAKEAGGHAMLLRAPAERRAALGLFPPQPPALAALSARVKAAFDPLNLFNPGRL